MAGVVGRRYWSDEEKRAIVSESLEAGTSIAAVARRHGMNANLVSTWRRDPRFAPALSSGARSEPEPVFLPVQIDGDMGEAGRAAPEPSKPSPPVAPSSTPVEIALACGTRLRVQSDIDAAALTRVIRAIGRAA